MIYDEINQMWHFSPVWRFEDEEKQTFCSEYLVVQVLSYELQ